MSEFIDIFNDSSKTDSTSSFDVPLSWVDKYKPKTLDDLVLDASTKDKLRAKIEKGDIPDMSLTGNPGIGKTTIALLLTKLVNAEVCFIPCGTDGTIDIVRNKIEPFCATASSGRLKCVILDEFDSASGSSASSNGMQKALRSVTDQHPDVRFIITCNYKKNILNALMSRCPEINISYTIKDVALKLKYIWEQEGIKYTKESATEFMKFVSKNTFPDIRATIRVAELFSATGELVVSEESYIPTTKHQIDNVAKNIIDLVKQKKSLNEIREFINLKMSSIKGDYEILVSAISNYAIMLNINPEFIAKSCNYAYRMSQVTDPSLQMYGLIVEMQKYF